MDPDLIVMLFVFIVILMAAGFIYYRFGPPQYKKEGRDLFK